MKVSIYFSRLPIQNISVKNKRLNMFIHGQHPMCMSLCLQAYVNWREKIYEMAKWRGKQPCVSI